MTTQYPWERREGEQPLAYEAFRQYLHLGKDRSLQGACDAVNRSYSLVRRWSSNYEWIERSRAYDSHLATADTDGLVHALAETRDKMRDKNLALMDKLRGLLDIVLDDHIVKREPPSIRWTQACVAMTKIEANSLLLGKEDKSAERVDNVMKLVEEALALSHRVPDAP